MHVRMNTRIQFRLDSIEQFETVVPTGRIKVDTIVPSGTGPYVLVRGPHVKVDGTLGVICHEGYMEFEELPATVQMRLWQTLVNVASGTVEAHNG